MTSTPDIQRVIDQAKQQRAEFIGSALKNNALPIALVAALSLVLLQFTGTPTEAQAGRAPTVEVVKGAG